MRNALIVVIIFLILIAFGIAFFAFFRSAGESRGRTGVFFSDNNGENWLLLDKLLPKGNFKGYDFFAIAAGSKIFVGTKNNGLFIKEGDGFRKIKDKNNILSSRATINKIVVDPFNEENIYLAIFQNNFGQVLLSRDFGKSFESVYTSSRKKIPVFSIAMDKTKKGVIYIGTGDGLVLKSLNGGKGWQRRALFNDSIAGIELNPFDQNQIYVILTKSGLFKSKDVGKSWVDLTSSFANFRGAKNIRRLSFDNLRADIVYSGSDFGALKSVDGGNSWESLPIILPPESLPVYAIQANPLDSDNIIIGAGIQIFQTFDNGITWEVKQLAAEGKIQEIIFNKNSPNEIYVITSKK